MVDFFKHIDKNPQFHPHEEIAHAITHGIGAWLSTIGLTLLVVLSSQKGDVWRIVSFSIYGCTLVFLYLASTLYHSFPQPKLKHVLRVIDHCSIYLLIAGTYTPFTLVTLRGPWGWTLFGVIWVLALLGVIFKLFYIHRFKVLSVMVYIMMGWLVLISGKVIFTEVPKGALIWLFIGGGFYTLGVVFYAWKKFPFHHAIWHLFV